MTSAAPGRRGIATVNGRPMECVILGKVRTLGASVEPRIRPYVFP
jgi:hypothetical protein